MRLRDVEALGECRRGGDYRLLPRPPGPFQGAADRHLRAATKELNRQDPKILAARARQRRGGGVKPAAPNTEKPGETTPLPAFCRSRFRGRRSVPLELEDFVLDAELRALQIGDPIPIRQGTAVLLIDGALQFGMLGF